MPYQDIEDSRMYQRAERLADAIWNAVIEWSSFARETVAQQLTRAVDSIGANYPTNNLANYLPNIS